MASVLSAPHFHNEEKAFAYVEARVWPEGPTCPHCGGVERISKMQGKSTRRASTSATSAASRSPFAWAPSSRAAGAAAYLASGDVSDRRQQEGHQLATSFTAPWASPQNRLVPVAPHPRSNARGRPCSVRSAAARLRSMKPTSAARRACRFRRVATHHKMACLA
jgi:hypothetical protein